MISHCLACSIPLEEGEGLTTIRLARYNSTYSLLESFHFLHDPSASFDVLICENKTISAVYCPTDPLTRPGAELRILAQLYAANIPDVLVAMNNNMSRPIPFVNSTYSKTLAFYDVTAMQSPLSQAYLC